MRISGHSLREHLSLLAPLFGIIAAVWLLRMILHQVGVPEWILFFVSINVAVPVAIIFVCLLIYVKRFGGYASIVLASFLLVSWSQILIVLAILISEWTGFANIYAAPEFSLPDDPGHWRHISGHLTFGIGLETLIGSFMGCLVFFILRFTKVRKG